MFTGIVQARGQVHAVQPTANGVRLTIDCAGWQPANLTLTLGDSICISGVCLTLADLAGPLMQFDVIPETLALTTLGSLKPGDQVNLEPSLTASTPLGGHFVQGHVDGVGQVIKVVSTEQGGSETRITIEPPTPLMQYMVPKGSVCIEGVSLTLAAVNPNSIEVALIPTTLQITTLGTLHVGNRVNIEADILSKTIVHHLQRMNLRPQK